MDKRFDLIVIGAGPAGSSAAAAAAECGVSVLLLEEHDEIGIPLACAEGLSRSTIKGWLDIKSEWIAQPLSGSIVRSPQGREFAIEYPNVGWILDRKVFDPALARIAEQKGAIMVKPAKAVSIAGDEVIVRQNGAEKKYRFRYVIAADGVTSNASRWLGIDTRMSLDGVEICAEYLLSNINVKAEYAHLIFGSQYAPGGYAWIFPKSAHSANVGLGLSPLVTKEKPKTMLDHWVEREFPAAKIEERIFSGVPARILGRYSGRNFCLVGDAARFTDPLSGAGIANGIKSGIIAGRNAARIIKGQKHNLQSEMEKEILNEIRWHYRVRNIYMKLTDEDLEDVFRIAAKIFQGRTVSDIDTHYLVKRILLYSPHLLKLGFRLLV